MQIDLTGKVAIVTGAGRGIGRSEVVALAAAGAAVVVNDVGSQPDGTGQDASPADAVAAAIRAAGGEAVANHDDVSLMRTGERLVHQALRVYGRLDIVVNNAGIVRPARVLDITEDDWDTTIATHLKGHFVVSQAAARAFVNQGHGGRIINTSSEAGLGTAGFASYGAAKEGIIGLTRTLALELARHRITANSIRPRAATRIFPIAVQAAMEMGEPMTDTLTSAAEAQQSTNTAAFDPAQVASLVLFLASDLAAEITGRDLIVGGGELTLLSGVLPDRTYALADEGMQEAIAALLDPPPALPGRSRTA